MSLRNKITLKNANITHIVTVLRMEIQEDQFDGYEHLHVQVNDVSDEDLLEHFPSTNAFIQSGLNGGGGVLVHCAMGKSRSAAVCIAFMLHREPSALNPSEALELLRQARSLCEPNDGFMEQLELYHKMGCPDDVVNHPLYQRWQYERAVEESVACGRGPEIDNVRFEDEHEDTTNQDYNTPTEIKCRMCRRKLATLPFIIPHEPQEKRRQPRQMQKQFTDPSVGAIPCAHVFLHPLTWMRPSLFPSPSDNPDSKPEDNNNLFPDAPLSGRLTCPNTACGSNIGKFAWQGIRCSCGEWVTPAIGLARARVDVLDASVKRGALTTGAGIRLPPGFIRDHAKDSGASRESL
ncbi:hypothetical protein AJ80_03016 [Polytolypa hystricis UAMH7299]|uniref:protein-tyrosine-phosphatase n=1 Tax=Polytolypa hystricis (strain UAMH7299) TaxID=1447883 RepID=A0A2B7YQP7_POLH7|nr:hypothetical protein AJ80_03016 [Polytolypa hystricis UAMH7299]